MHKLHKSTLVYIAAILIFLVSLVSCQKIPDTQEIAPDFAEGKTVIVEITAPASTTALSGNPTETSIPTRTATLTRTATPMPSPTWTSIPTLQELQAKEFINKLLAENANCELPCVWGMIPGKTTWYEAQQFLQRFLEHKSKNGNPAQDMEANYGLIGTVEEVNISIYVKQYEIFGFHLSSPGTEVGYRLDQILTRYGEPEEAYITTYPNYPAKGILPFDMILYYPEYGFSALFNFNAENIGDHLRVCPSQQGIGPEIDVWDPQNGMSLEQLYYPYFESPTFKLLSIEEALGMSLEQFTSEYMNGHTNSCFTTPKDLW